MSMAAEMSRSAATAMSVTVNVLRASPQDYRQVQPRINTAFDPDRSLKAD